MLPALSAVESPEVMTTSPVDESALPLRSDTAPEEPEPSLPS
jgi:hypothetical protein